MKNNIAAYAAMVFLLAPAAADARWGTDFTASSWEMDAKDMETTRATYKNAVKNANTALTGFSGPINQGKVGGSASFFVEGNSLVRLGISAGYGVMPGVSIKIHKIQTGAYNDTSLDTKTTYVPVDMYLKFGSKGGGSNFSLGGGADFVTVKSDYKFTNSAGTTHREAVFTQKKMLPHAQAGFEFFLAKWLSFGVNAKYVFSGVLDNMTGELKQNGVSQGKKKLSMQKDGPSGINGLKIGYVTTGTLYTAPERSYQYDYSGLRVNVAMRWYFGGGKQASAAPAQRTGQVRTQVIGEPVVQEQAPAPAPAATSADSEAMKLEREKLELEKAKLKLEQEKFEFEKQSGKNE